MKQLKIIKELKLLTEVFENEIQKLDEKAKKCIIGGQGNYMGAAE